MLAQESFDNSRSIERYLAFLLWMFAGADDKPLE